MTLRLFPIAATIVISFALPVSATVPPMPPLTNGDGNVANDGMKHANITLTGTTLEVHIGDPPAAPVTMTSGFGVDYTPAKFDVLEDVYFNAQHGWLPGGILVPPAGSEIWIRRTAVTQPAGSTFKVYDGGNGAEGMGAWTMNEIHTPAAEAWLWDRAMQHDYFTADRAGNYSMSFEVYVGDANGDPRSGFAPAETTFHFVVVPEPATWILAIIGLSVLAQRR